MIKPHHRSSIAAGVPLLALLLASCAPPFTMIESRISATPTATAAVIKAAPDDDDGPTSSIRSNGPIAPVSPDVGPIVRDDGNGAVIARPQPHTSVGPNGDVSLNYADADVKEVVRLVLGDILKVNYTIDPGFQGTVTIQTARPLRRDELLPTLQGLLEQAGGSMTYRNGIFRVSATGDETIVPPVVASSSVEAGTQVVPLHFASARQLAAVLEPYVGDAAKILADPGRNVLIVTGSASARQGAIDLIEVFDVDYLAGQSYALFPVKTGDPNKVAADLEAALQVSGEGPLAGALKIVPIVEANAIMAIAQQSAYLDRVSRLMAQLDRVKEVAGRTIHVYYLKNVQPTDLQPLLQRAVNPPTGGGGTGEIAPGNLPPTAVPAEVSAPAAMAPTPASNQAPTMGFPAAGAAPESRPATPLDTGSSPSPAGGNANGPQIIADRNNGALIIVATEAEYRTIEAAIRKLDVLPMQVLVEATIAEVTLNNKLQFGTQFYLTNSQGQATLSNAISTQTIIDPSNPLTNGQLFPGLLAPAFPGLAIARTIGEQQFAIQALKDITDVQIISAPKLLILDKQQAKLQVGDLVPTITQSATSVISAGAPVINSVQYQATGVILTVTPHINAGGLVTLDIEQEVSDVIPTTSSSINSPTFQQRKVQTKVVVQNGETISLAGMISDKRLKGSSGIPLLQEIPVFGALFSNRTKSAERTELLVLLTPRVISTLGDARALTDELRRKLAPSNLVP